MSQARIDREEEEKKRIEGGLKGKRCGGDQPAIHPRAIVLAFRFVLCMEAMHICSSRGTGCLRISEDGYSFRYGISPQSRGHGPTAYSIAVILNKCHVRGNRKIGIIRRFLYRVAFD